MYLPEPDRTNESMLFFIFLLADRMDRIDRFPNFGQCTAGSFPPRRPVPGEVNHARRKLSAETPLARVEERCMAIPAGKDNNLGTWLRWSRRQEGYSPPVFTGRSSLVAIRGRHSLSRWWTIPKADPIASRLVVEFCRSVVLFDELEVDSPFPAGGFHPGVG
jgi:hypothetical protein